MSNINKEGNSPNFSSSEKTPQPKLTNKIKVSLNNNTVAKPQRHTINNQIKKTIATNPSQSIISRT